MLVRQSQVIYLGDINADTPIVIAPVTVRYPMKNLKVEGCIRDKNSATVATIDVLADGTTVLEDPIDAYAAGDGVLAEGVVVTPDIPAGAELTISLDSSAHTVKGWQVNLSWDGQMA